MLIFLIMIFFCFASFISIVELVYDFFPFFSLQFYFLSLSLFIIYCLFVVCCYPQRIENKGNLFYNKIREECKKEKEKNKIK